MITTDEKQYLTPKELGIRLRIGRNKTYSLLKESGFPAYRIGKEYRIPVDELDEWLKSKCRETGGENE